MTVRDLARTIVETLFRWVPSPVETGVKVFGKPDRQSPVLLTCDYHLTVKRVSAQLEGVDCYLLVAPSRGINVWCASCGGDLNEFSVISVIKTSKIGEKVDHRVIVAPQLSAPGIDVRKVKEETGWEVRFGPVYAKDIPQYLRSRTKPSRMRLVRFGLVDRLEMATVYFVTTALVLSLPLLIFFRSLYFSSLALAGGMIYFVYAFFPRFPFRSGFLKIAASEALFLALILPYSYWSRGNPLAMPHLLIVSVLVSAVVGMDFNGTSPTYKSDLGELLYHRGHKNMAFPTGVYHLGTYGQIRIDQEKCIGCGACYEVCPKEVYEMDRGPAKAMVAEPEECVNCGACVKQCPVNCLKIA